MYRKFEFVLFFLLIGTGGHFIGSLVEPVWFALLLCILFGGSMGTWYRGFCNRRDDKPLRDLLTK